MALALMVLAAPAFSKSLSLHLSGRDVRPPVETQGVGQLTLKPNKNGDQLWFKLNVANLEGVTGAYIRKALDNRIIAVLFPQPAVPWTGQGTLAEGSLVFSINVGGPEALFSMLDSGQAFAVVHTGHYPNGEIASSRGPLPIELSIISPSKDMSELPLVPTSGFPLSIEMVANNELGIYGGGSAGRFPKEGQGGYIVFDDPDLLRDTSDPLYACLSWEPRYSTTYCCEDEESTNCVLESAPCSDSKPCSSGVCVRRYGRFFTHELWIDPPCEVNETYLEFTPDIDLPGVPDLAGNIDLREDPDNGLASSNPEMTVFSKSLHGGYMEPGTNSTVVAVGPQVDISPWEQVGDPPTPVLDGYGPGANDDLPGLVLLADAGFGLIFDDETKDVVGARNLAGFLNTVSYVLVDGSDRVRVEANLMAPKLLFRPLVLVDQAVSDPELGETAPDNIPRKPSSDPNSDIPLYSQIRIDGGAVAQVGFSGYGYVIPDENLSITVRAFVVNGTAPARMEDRNDDGVIDASDLLPEYELISNEALAQFELHYDGIEDIFGYYFYDLDGNGYAAWGEVLPEGGGRITPVPR